MRNSFCAILLAVAAIALVPASASAKKPGNKPTPAASAYNLILVDADTGEQVGVHSGDFAFKVDLYNGGSAVRFGYPQPLPPVQTNSESRTLWLIQVDAMYTCDGTLLGWGSTWAENRNSNPLPREMDRQIRTHQFGSLPSGDVVTAIIDSQTSVVWSADYSGICGLDPDIPECSNTHPEYVSFTGDCFFYTNALLDNGIDSNGDGFEDAGSNPFNMTWSTALWEIANASHGGSPQPRYTSPIIFVSTDQITDPITGMPDPNPGNPKYDELQTKCRELSGMPQDSLAHCLVQHSGDRPNTVSAVQAPVLKSATYTSTQSVNAIEVVGEIAGNRGGPRTFVTEWR